MATKYDNRLGKVNVHKLGLTTPNDAYMGFHNGVSKLWRGIILANRLSSGSVNTILTDQNDKMLYPSADDGPTGYVKHFTQDGIDAYKKSIKFLRNPDRSGKELETFDNLYGEVLGREGENPMGTYYIAGEKWSKGYTKLAQSISDAGIGSSVDNYGSGSNNFQLQALSNKVVLEVIDNNNPYSIPASIELPFIPSELSLTPDLKVIPIMTPGKNTAFYHYTGAEDTLELNIDWFSISDESKRYAVEACRLIESWAKNDGYNKKPYTIRIIWGREDVLFRDMEWVISSAPYVMSNFERGHRQTPTGGTLSGKFINTALLPSQAKQTLTLKRISSDNLTRTDIQTLIPAHEYEDNVLSYRGTGT